MNIRRGTRAWTNLRATWTPLVNTGTLTCPQCNNPIHPEQPWDLGHHTPATLGGTHHNAHPEHATCNRKDGAQLGNALRNRPTPARAL